MNCEQTTIINDDIKHKVIFLGDASVGKTSLVEYIMFGSCKSIYQPTICLQSAKKIVSHNNQIYKLMLWDTAGQQKFNSLIPSFVRGSSCAIVVYDVTNRQSLINCQKWLKILKQANNQQQLAIILVGNKTDLAKNVTTGQAFELALKHKMSFLEVSAKEGKGVQQLISQVVQGIQKVKCKSEKQTKSTDSELNSSRRLEMSKAPKQVKMKPINSCCSI